MLEPDPGSETIPTMKTLHDLLAEYVKHLRSLNYSVRTGAEIRYTLRKALRWLDQTLEVDEPQKLRSGHLASWQQHLSETKNFKGYLLRPATVNKTLSFMKSFLLFMAARGYVVKSLADTIQRVKEPQTLPGNVLNHGQIKRLLSRIDTSTPEGQRNRAIMELLYSSGVRARELLGLNVGDINFEQATALVHGKGAKDRMVPIGKSALKHLRSYVVAIRPFFLRDRTEKALFLSSTGKRYSYDSMRDWLRRHAQAMDLDTTVTAHTFRRSCTTEMIRGGANLYHIKELLGHATLRTLKHYTKLTITDLKKTHQKCHPREKDE